MKKPMFKRRAGGFTLVELMVAVVIVIALAALAFGMTKNAMTKSRLASSTSAVRNLGVLIQNYAQENAGQLPVWQDQSQDLYWWGLLVEDPRRESELEIFHSPGHKEFDGKYPSPNLSYGWNARVMGRYETSAGDEGPKRLASFKEPARVLVLADGPAKGGQALLDQGHLPDPERYDGKAAALLLDGSARALEIESEFKSGSSQWFMTESERDARGHQ